MLRLAALLCLAFLTVGTTVASPSVRSTVAATVVEMRSQDPEAGGRCSAVMVAPGRAFTAEHCIQMIKDPLLTVNGVDHAVLSSHAVENASDVAVLIVPGAPCPCATLAGVSNRAKVGDKVMAAGYPLVGLLIVTRGEVQAVDVVNPADGKSYIMSTAQTAPGFSGGGVFDAQGRLLGINSASGVRGLLSLYGQVWAVFVTP